ncbi:hypothetical protein ESA94_13740 [Lacibacter luteus]|uniref:Uncharacterized protein n=1 Tax=Lacibacter luteus TaxID=2508719 RepID=A0A4Q1CGC4_9BACT|nr:hypothetical protein [Lacibacter luteus]RXK59198.1 hypothetical protein ESA94_13740 [Lacibacter luteus]
MKKIVLLAAVIVTAAVGFVLAQNNSKASKKVLTTTVWYYTGTTDEEITNPLFYSQTGSESGCGSTGNVPCAIDVPNNMTPGDAEDDLEAYLAQFAEEPSELLPEARSRKTL